jgi:myo-inositol catabolism protein IolC
MPRGYDHALYFLPFDHRSSFQAKLFGWKSHLSDAQTAQISDAKEIIYDGFKSALAAGVPKDKAGILVDEQFGAAILRDAAADHIVTACPAEKSGQDEFEFEYGEKFADHVRAVDPAFCKVLVRYNPQADRSLNRRQADRLRRLSDFLAGENRSRFLFELLVPSEKWQLDQFGGDQKAYDLELRPQLMIAAIGELHDAGVEPDIWKVEGLDRREDCALVAAAARADGRDHVRCIVLGRGAEEARVRHWLEVAAAVPGFIGFAVGRTTFWDPLVGWRNKTMTREQAVAEIARRYRELVNLFEAAAPAGVS